MIPTNQPAAWNAEGRARAPVPTIRLKMNTPAVRGDIVGGPTGPGDPTILP